MANDVEIEIEDGGLGQLPASIANVTVKLGICSDGTPNTLYSAGDPNSASSQLGQGPLVENMADTLNVAGGPQYAMPLTPTTAGTVSSTTYAGTGTGTVVAARAPHKQVLLKIETGGAPGTMTFRYSVAGAAYSAPVATTAGAFSYLVPGTLCTVTFADQTYTTAAVWTISTAGVIGLSGTGTVGWVTQVSSPLDAYSAQVTITTSGALGAAVFTYSMDGGESVSGAILVPSGAVYVIPNTGLYLTFAGTFTEHASPYTFTSATATYGTSDVTSAFVALRALPVEWSFAHVIGMGASAAAAASMASIIDTQMTAAETEYRYVFTAMECPTNGSGTSTESDTTVATAFASFVSTRVMVCAGDIGHISSLSGRVIRRNCATVVTSRLAAIRPAEHPGYVGSSKGTLKNVRRLYRDEAKSPLLDAQRFTTLTTRRRAGYYVKRGNMMAAGGSDYSSVMNRRVVDVACRVTVQAVEIFLNKDLAVDETTGGIYQPEADAIEAFVNGQLTAELIDNKPENASAVSVLVDRTNPILTTHELAMTVGVVPKGYAERISVRIGLRNPALAA